MFGHFQNINTCSGTLGNLRKYTYKVNWRWCETIWIYKVSWWLVRNHMNLYGTLVVGPRTMRWYKISWWFGPNHMNLHGKLVARSEPDECIWCLPFFVCHQWSLGTIWRDRVVVCRVTTTISRCVLELVDNVSPPTSRNKSSLHPTPTLIKPW